MSLFIKAYQKFKNKAILNTSHLQQIGTRTDGKNAERVGDADLGFEVDNASNELPLTGMNFMNFSYRQFKSASKFNMVLFFAIASLLFQFSTATAQKSGKTDTLTNTDLPTEQIDIIKPYQPILADAVKIPFFPDAPKVSTPPTEFHYDINQQQLVLPFQQAIIKPSMLPKENKMEKYPTLFAKVGFGNYTSPYADIFYNTTKNKAYQYGAELFHHSAQSATLKSQKTSINQGKIFAKYLLKNNVLTGKFEYNRKLFNFYGSEFNQLTPFSSDSVHSRVITSIAPSISFRNTAGLSKVQYESNLTAYLINPSLNQTKIGTYYQPYNWQETGIKFYNSFHVPISEAYGEVNMNLNFYYTSATDKITITKPATNLLTNFNPYYLLRKDTWAATLGLNMALDGKTLSIYPHYESEKEMINKHLIYYNGWKGWVEKNSMQTIAEENPYANFHTTQNTYIQDSYMGVKGAANKYFSYNLKATHLILKHQRMFINDSTSVNYSAFNTYYDAKGDAVNIHTDMAFNQNDKIEISAAADYYNYYKLTDPSSIAWNLPNLTGAVKSTYNINDKLQLSGEVFGWSSTQTKVTYNNLPKNKGNVDVNLGARYKLHNNVSAWVQINNLLNQKYQRFLYYPSYGINGHIGVILTY